MLNTVALLHIFEETVKLYSEFFDKKNSVSEIKIFSNVINVFTVTFDLFNVFLLNKYKTVKHSNSSVYAIGSTRFLSYIITFKISSERVVTLIMCFNY